MYVIIFTYLTSFSRYIAIVWFKYSLILRGVDLLNIGYVGHHVQVHMGSSGTLSFIAYPWCVAKGLSVDLIYTSSRWTWGRQLQRNAAYLGEYWLITYLALSNMITIPQTIFLNRFSQIKSFVFRFKFHWSLFLGVQMTMTQHWFR